MKSTGQNFLDVGKCEGLCAQRSSFNQSCGGKGECCCGPKGEEYLERVLIDCSPSNYTKPWSLMEVYRVKECGCSACIEQETVITGGIISFYFYSDRFKFPKYPYRLILLNV